MGAAELFRPPPFQPWQATSQNAATLPCCACVPHCWRVEQQVGCSPLCWPCLVAALLAACLPLAWLIPAMWPVEAARLSPLMRGVGCQVCMRPQPLSEKHLAASVMPDVPPPVPRCCAAGASMCGRLLWAPLSGRCIRFAIHPVSGGQALCCVGRSCHEGTALVPWLSRAGCPLSHPSNHSYLCLMGLLRASVCARACPTVLLNGTLAAGAAPPVVSRAWSTFRRPVSSS